MAYANGFSGDVRSLQHILQTLDRKLVAIPGVTCSGELSVTENAEIAYFFKRGVSSVKTGKVGNQVSFDKAGVTRVDIPMVDAVTIGAVLPRVNYSTISDDVVGDTVIKESITAANKYNELFVAALSKATNKATGTDPLTKDNVYDKIVDTIKQFKLKNKANGLKPEAIVVGPTASALLQSCPQFLRSTALGDDVVSEGYIGKVAGLKVVEALDLNEGASDNLDFIVLHPEGFAAPQNINSLFITDGTAAGYPGGTIVSGEIGHGFLITDQNLIMKRCHA